MNAEEAIRGSTWWREAQGMPDRHYDESAGVALADHLLRVHGNLRLLLSSDGLDGYFEGLRETLPENQENRDTLLALVEEHDTPYSWYMQFQMSGQIPKRKSWARLDRKIDPREDGTGLVLLSVFKIADIDGHEDVADVPWFIDQANLNFLRDKGKWLPVPDQESIRRLVL